MDADGVFHELQPGETLADAARRELLEELSLRVREVGAPLFECADPGSCFNLIFVRVSVDGEPVPNEHSALAWVRPSELENFSLAPSDNTFAQRWKEWSPEIGDAPNSW